MGYPQTQTPNLGSPHLYSQALQLKLYQAFIFSIPVLFSIIIFLLFYLFYLKRKSITTSTSPPPILPTTSNQASSLSGQPSEMGLKKNLEDKLLVIVFDEELSNKDSQCCVCLGEFEMREKLHQIPSCRHVFHSDCIRHWFNSNSTCPLCRCSLVTITATVTKDGHPNPGPDPVNWVNPNFNTQGVSLEQEEELFRADPSFGICSSDHNLFEGSSSTTSTSICKDNKMSHPNEESQVLSIQIHDT